jgi:hypothetical protein
LLNFSRVVLLLSLATFITTGTGIAQQPPPQPQMPMATKPPQGAPNKKCAQTPKGCHKNQPKPPSGSAPPPRL